MRLAWICTLGLLFLFFAHFTQPVALAAEPQIKIAHVWCANPCSQVGESIRFSAWIENSGDSQAELVPLDLQVDEGVKAVAGPKEIKNLPAGSFERVDWTLSSEKAATAWLKLTAGTVQAQYRVLVVDPAAKYTRQQLMTDDKGYWRILDRPTTLQEKNAAPLVDVKHKTSKEIKHNVYGICANVPRAKDYEDPFNPAHLTDGDPNTCWSSQQNSSPYPGCPPWAKIDLGQTVSVKQVNLIPYWRNSNFPVGFSVQVSSDGEKWETVLTVKNHPFNQAGPARGDKKAQEFPLPKAVDARWVRIDFERLPLSGGNYAEVSEGYKARLSEIEVLDSAGNNAALTKPVEVSDSFTGWDSTKKAVDGAFAKIPEIGLKLIRVGQWGDQTIWATVEREKGKFAMDPVTDAAIRDITDQGVNILWTLDYGNSLYNTPGDGGTVMDIGPIFKEGSPFAGNYGPRTEEQRQAFVRYVDFVVNRYKDRVKYWELWNEENGWYPVHEPELYGKLLAAVGKQIKEIDPKTNFVYGGTAAPAPIHVDISLREGGAPYVDIYAFHPYGMAKPEAALPTLDNHQGKDLSKKPEEYGWKTMEDVVAAMKKIFADHGKPDVGVWLDEWGTNPTGLDFSYDPHMGEYATAKYCLRYNAMAARLNARTAWWALHNLNMSQDWGALDQKDCGFRPITYALQNMCSVVSDVTPFVNSDCKYGGPADEPKIIAFTRDGKDETVVLAWNAEPSTDEIKTYASKLSIAVPKRPTRVTVTDLYWGVTQAAEWSYEEGRLVLDRLLMHDYPVVMVIE